MFRFRKLLYHICARSKDQIKKAAKNSRGGNIMSKNNTVHSTVFIFISVALMAAMFLLQFVPFWTEGDASVSINGLIWIPSEHTALQSDLMNATGGEFNLSSFVGMPILQTVSALIGIVVCLWKSDYCAVSLLPMICGGAGLWCYLTNPAMQLGSGWILHLTVSILMLLCGCVGLITGLTEQKK